MIFVFLASLGLFITFGTIKLKTIPIIAITTSNSNKEKPSNFLFLKQIKKFIVFMILFYSIEVAFKTGNIIPSASTKIIVPKNIKINGSIILTVDLRDTDNFISN